MPSLRRKKIFQIAYWPNANFVKKIMDETIVDTYKHNFIIDMKVIILQSSVKKNVITRTSSQNIVT